MEKRVVVPALLALAVGLAFGAVGPATAAGLTRGAVKRLATQVVNAKAPTLSVAHADTADTAATAGSAATAKDAQTVGGATAAQLGVRPIVFTKTSGSINSGNGINLHDIPAGSYLVTINVYNAVAGNWIDCDIYDATAAAYRVLSGDTPAAGRPAVVNAAGYATVPDGHQMQLACFSNADLVVNALYPWTVTFTPVAGVTGKAM